MSIDGEFALVGGKKRPQEAGQMDRLDDVVDQESVDIGHRGVEGRRCQVKVKVKNEDEMDEDGGREAV